MKKTIKGLMGLVAILFLLSVLQASALAAEKKVNFKVEGVTCLSIAYTAESIPKKFDGVQSSKFDFAEDGVVVLMDDSKVSIEDITKAFDEGGYKVVSDPVVME